MPDIVGFQGINGANSEIAIFQHYNNTKVKTYPVSELNELFEALRTQKVTSALVPVENSSAGAVMGAYELLMNYDFRIQADVILHVHHALITLPDTKIEDIECVQSHPQALAQCERYLQRNNWKPMRWYDTAGAAKDLATSKSPKTAALATTKAAELYGLKILAEQVEDFPFNYTRFFLLGMEDPKPSDDYNKTSVVFATRNTPAALYECLGEFAKRGLNLTKIESRPRLNRPWEPIFFVDFEGYWQEKECKEALTSLLQKASFVKMLGSYPAVKTDSVGI